MCVAGDGDTVPTIESSKEGAAATFAIDAIADISLTHAYAEAPVAATAHLLGSCYYCQACQLARHLQAVKLAASQRRH